MKTTKLKNGNKIFGTPAHNKEVRMARKERDLIKSRNRRKKLGIGKRSRVKIIKKKKAG